MVGLRFLLVPSVLGFVLGLAEGNTPLVIVTAICVVIAVAGLAMTAFGERRVTRSAERIGDSRPQRHPDMGTPVRNRSWISPAGTGVLGLVSAAASSAPAALRVALVVFAVVSLGVAAVYAVRGD